VAKAAAAALTKVLPSKTTDSSLSGLSIIFATSKAPLTLVLTICSNRNLCKDMKAVSELEKKADKTRQTTRRMIYSVSVPDIKIAQPSSQGQPQVYLKIHHNIALQGCQKHGAGLLGPRQYVI
jgi:hypothetical protein